MVDATTAVIEPARSLGVKTPPLETVELDPLPQCPLVSIIVPSYNQGRFIGATIDSILAQDYRPLRIHVIDGASRDETLKVLKSFGDIPELVWVSEPDSGVVEAVNKAFSVVDGAIIGIQSSDDRYLPGAVSRVVEEFWRRPGVGLIYGDTVKIDQHGRELARQRIGPWSLENLLLLRTWIPQPSCFFRRELLERCGGWNEQIPYAPDTDLWLRMAFRTQVRKIDVYLSEHRVHAAQRDSNAARILVDYCKMIELSPDVAAAPRRLRRAARAGCELMYRRYNPSGSALRALWHDFKAVLIFPPAFDRHHWWGLLVVLPLKRLLHPLANVKQWLGCWLHERWRTEIALSGTLSGMFKLSWVDLCNRHEIALHGDHPASRIVEAEYTSYLTVSRVFPRVGGRLLSTCFAENPLPPVSGELTAFIGQPLLSVLIPVGGMERKENFTLVLADLLRQTFRPLEVIVLEHSPQPLYDDDLPEGVRYSHFAMSQPNEEFNKSMLFNEGARLARASMVMLHDADILVPSLYVERAMEQLACGYDAIRPIRFLFYLSCECTRMLQLQGVIPQHATVASIAQNFHGGSTLVRMETYWNIGGHDESFLGWGGEDLEFLERLGTQKLFRGGMLPALHLWHPDAEKKYLPGGNLDHLAKLREQAPAERIRWLTDNLAGPAWVPQDSVSKRETR